MASLCSAEIAVASGWGFSARLRYREPQGSGAERRFALTHPGNNSGDGPDKRKSGSRTSWLGREAAHNFPSRFSCHDSIPEDAHRGHRRCDIRTRHDAPSHGRRHRNACFRAGVCDPYPRGLPSALACPSPVQQPPRILPTGVCSCMLHTPCGASGLPCRPTLLFNSLHSHDYEGIGPKEDSEREDLTQMKERASRLHSRLGCWCNCQKGNFATSVIYSLGFARERTTMHAVGIASG
jgi:hypothetical protein